MLKELIEHFCVENDLSFRDDYSGRFMYGKTCVGIVFEQGQNEYRLLLELCEFILYSTLIIEDFNIEFDDLIRALGDPKRDSMGLGTILYFPDMKDI